VQLMLADQVPPQLEPVLERARATLQPVAPASPSGVGGAEPSATPRRPVAGSSPTAVPSAGRGTAAPTAVGSATAVRLTPAVPTATASAAPVVAPGGTAGLASPVPERSVVPVATEVPAQLPTPTLANPWAGPRDRSLTAEATRATATPPPRLPRRWPYGATPRPTAPDTGNVAPATPSRPRPAPPAPTP
jgi:hypothetical protein